MSRNRILQAVLCLIFIAGAVFAQTASTTGEINGTVTDNSGAVLPGVTVTATNTETGLTRSVVTESNGNYSIPLLPPGTYRVHAELAGLGEARRDVRVLLGQASNTRFSLNPQITEEITVTAESPLVDTTQSGATEAVTEEEIANLPILGRDFKDLVLLTPGVSNSFGGRVSLNGARGMSTDYNIDGANANSDFFGEERGGTAAPYVFSQAAIKEFQVIRSSYSVEYARGGGGTMNAITKSGTNQVSGEAFFYRRDQEWSDERDLPPNVNEFFDPRDADQYGFAVGGPIMRDRLFYFVNGDFQKIEEPFTSTDFRSSATFNALPADVRQSVVARLEQLVGHPLDQEFAYDTRENQDTWLGKIDWNIGSANHFNVRWNYSDFNNFPSESSGTLSNQGDEYNTVNSYVAQADSILSPSMYNFALLQYSLEERPINALTTSFPQIGINGLLPSGSVFFGQRDFLPNGTDEEKFEIKDTLSWMLGDHQVRVGFNYLTVDIANLFVRDLAGDFRFNTPAQFLAGTPSSFEQGFGLSPVTAFDFDQYGLFVMDSWRPTPRLTVDYGVRWDGQSTPKPIRNVYESTNPEFENDFKSDTDNFAPRVGFAYDLGGNGRSVIRGGVGQYYNFIPAILYAQPVQQIGGLFNNYTFTCSSVQCPTFPSLYTEEQLAGFNPSEVRDIAIVDPDLEAQETVRGSLGYEQQLGAGYSFELEGVYADHSKQQRFVNVNAIPTGRMYGNLVEYTTAGAGRPYPNFSNVRKHVTDAEGKYTSATVGVRKIAVGGSNLTWLAHYTWSEAIDQDSNSRSTSTSFSWDPYDAEISEGPADYDTEHKVVASATYELPYGFLVSGIFNWRTGQPYTRNIFYSGGLQSLTGIPRMGVNTSVFVDESGNVIDLTQAHNSTPDQFAAFLNERGARLLGRNTENQPDFMNLDMRLAKRFGLPAGLELELIAEIFNVLNETNTFITANNQSEFTIRLPTSGSTAGKYQITKNANFGVENGLDFNSPPRQYQAAVKIRF